MYIKSARITNIRSIEDFEISFEESAGWHVLIGDNGSGKSTIIRSIALALVGEDEAGGLRADWGEWLNKNKDHGNIILKIMFASFDSFPKWIPVDSEARYKDNNENYINFKFERKNFKGKPSKVVISSSDNRTLDEGFSVAYGPYRRFSGGNQEWEDVFANQPRLGAHLSVFGEDVALTEVTKWLVQMNYKTLEKEYAEKYDSLLDNLGKFHNADELEKPELQKNIKIGIKENLSYLVERINAIKKGDYYASELSTIDNLKSLINSSKFLPNDTKLEKISSEGVFFKDGNGNMITINQLSDGYRSILSLTLELIRQLIRVYGEENVFKNIREDKMYIDLPGVVLIDEIDAHLHPTWQTKIGQWFLKYFPNLQFIVTTHSPLVCRAAEKGTIWKLAAPGSGEKSEQVTGTDRDRLIYGNVLDAYGTEEFGIVDNIKATDKKEELVQLSKKQIAGKISTEEENKLHQLRAIFSTDAAIEL